MSGVAAMLALLVTVLFMFALRPVAEKIALVDVPGGRKRHHAPIPLIGGLAMAVGFFFGVVLGEQPAYVTPLAAAVLLLVTIGTIDDRFDLPASVRLFAQACASLILLIGANIRVVDLGAPLAFDLPLGVLSVPFTMLFVMALINAFNMIDGIDGLAGGLALVALAALAFVGHGTSSYSLVLVLAASVAGFLLFNLPLKINRHVHAFMGDAGSTFIGLVIAAVGIVFSQGAAAEMSPVVGLWFVAVPVFDLFSSIARRVFAGKSPFKPDDEHLHHALRAAGLTCRETLSVILALALFLAVIGLLARFAHVADTAMLALWVAAGVGYYQMMRKPTVVVRVVRSVITSETGPERAPGI